MEGKETHFPVFVGFNSGENGEEERRSLFPKGGKQVVAVELLDKGTVRGQWRGSFIEKLETT